MIEAITMPFWGMEDAPGTVVGWLVEEGQGVTRGQELVEVETSKLTNVVEAPRDGILARRVLPVGEKAPGGALLAIIADAAPSEAEIQSFLSRFATTHDQASASPFEEKVLATRGGDVSVLVRKGDSRNPVVLLHGFGADVKGWSFNIGEVAHGRTVVAVDLPGHGSSFKQLGETPIETVAASVVEAIRALSNAPVHLVGHSFGGLVALQIAARHPELCSSLSLIAPAGFGGTINGAFLEAFANADSRKSVRAALEMVVSDPKSINLAAVNDVLRARRLEGAAAALNALRAALAEGDRQLVEAGPLLAEIRQPVLVIWGSRDAILPVAAGLPEGIRLEIVDGAGHLPHVENVGAVNQLLDRFLAEQP